MIHILIKVYLSSKYSCLTVRCGSGMSGLMDFTTPEAKKIFSEMGKRGGKVRAEKLSAKRRAEIAAMGGKARAGIKRKEPQ